MELKRVLENFSERVSSKINLYGIIQFGSSTYSKNSKDVDLAIFSKEDIFSTEDYFSLIEIMKEFEKKHKEISFNLGEDKSKSRKISISLTPIQMIDIKNKIDLFFLKNISEDKSKKTLIGLDPTKIKIKIGKDVILERLSIEINHHLRNIFDEKKKKQEVYSLFKTTLRLMLINEGVPKKSELINKFKEKYKIKLPKNSKKILEYNISQKDCFEVLKFSENCLRNIVLSKK